MGWWGGASSHATLGHRRQSGQSVGLAPRQSGVVGQSYMLEAGDVLEGTQKQDYNYNLNGQLVSCTAVFFRQ